MQRSTQKFARFATLAVVAVWTAIALAAPATAQNDDAAPGNQTRIIEVAGLIDPVLADLVLTELNRAEADGVLAFVLQMDSLGSVLDDDDYLELATRLRDSSVQTAIWVGPTGFALGGSAELLGVVDVVGVSPGSRVGETGPARLPESFGPAFGDATKRLEEFSVDANEAIAAGIKPDKQNPTVSELEQVATIPAFLTSLEGFDPSAAEAARFIQLPLTSQFFHTMASPEVTYLLIIGGLGLLVFELFTAGVGIAGLIGAFCLAFGCYGLAILPFNPVGVGLIVLGMLALSVDIQVNLPRAYTAVGLVLVILGTFLFWDGVTMSWVTGATGIVGSVLYAYLGMPTMVRTRFSSPVIGRKWLVGEAGEALSAITDSDGSVEIHGAAWPAKSATGIGVGQAVTVVGVERITMVVEPA